MPKNGSKVAQRKNTKKPPTQCCRYDITIWDDISANEVRKILNEFCKKYCFQQEKGEKNEGIHFQGRVSLKQKKRESEAIKMFSKNLSKFHVSVTSNENKDNDFYVLKEEGRIDGPFTDLNEQFIPKDVEEMKTLRPFQKKIADLGTEYDKRTVHIIYDPDGNNGKTSIVRWMMCYKDAAEIPFCNEFRDVMRMGYDMGPKKIYFIDMPRALPKNKMEQFFAAIEKLKSGYAYDDRNHFKYRLFDRPQIFVFTNVMPDLSLLSKDMWKIWTIQNQDLVPYKNPIDDLLDVKTEPEFEFRSSESESLRTESDTEVLTPMLTDAGAKR